MCRNPGCERLATIEVKVVGVGIRDFCEVCWRALVNLGMDIRRTDGVEPTPIRSFQVRAFRDLPVPA